jgi:chaperonin GroEL
MNKRKNPIQVKHGQDARMEIARGVDIAARAVGATFGPMGGTVIMEKAGGNIVATSDGVSVAREAIPGYGLQKMGAQILRDACAKVEEVAGDGTTTTAIVVRDALLRANKLVSAGFDPMQIASELREAADVAVDLVAALAKPVGTKDILLRVAALACNGDMDVAEALADACMIAGTDGTVSVEDGVSTEIEMEVKEGLEIASGMASSYFTTGVERIMEAPLVAVIDAGLAKVEDIQELLEVASQWPGNHLLLFAHYIEGEALSTMVMNDQKGTVRSCAVRTPGVHTWRRETLKDIAAVTGATMVDPAYGMSFKDFDPEWFGSARRATVGLSKTVVEAYDEASDQLESRISELLACAASSSSDYDKDRYAERAAEIGGGLVVLRVGDVTEGAAKERRGRIEDALGAVRGALEAGVVPGACNGLHLVGDILEEEAAGRHGWMILAESLRTPLKVLAHSGGTEGPVASAKVREAEGWDFEGWDPIQGRIRSLLEDPVLVDSARSAEAVIRAAASSAAMLITCEAAITGVH